MQTSSYRVIGSDEEGVSLFYMMDSLLKSRIETGEETTDDEDVNVYLAGLLHSFIDRSFFDCNGSYLSRYDADVLSHAESADDLRMKYRVYKGNADFALMSLGVFGGIPQRLTPRKLSEANDETIAERGRIYYRVACDTRVRLRRRKSGVAEVLEKLAERFGTYARILTHLRCSHLRLINRMTRGEVYHLQREVHERAKPNLFGEGQNQFLDAYWDWLQSDSALDRGRVNRLGRDLKELDPAFEFNDL